MNNKDNLQPIYPVMVLAHNEERHIGACLDSILNGDPDLSLEIYVMANGCSDRTEDIVRDYARAHPSVHLISIELGDKCNAWNVFVHETALKECPECEVYFFVDGDARFVPGSFSSMIRCLQEDPYANAVGAPPASGRSMKHDRDELLNERGLVANLYALRGEFVKRIIENGVRIPLGLEGDDGLIGALVRWNLDPTSPMDGRRIAPCKDAGFVFESMKLQRIEDWIAYWKRMVRYGRRRYEFVLLGKCLRQLGVGGMPAHIKELYDQSEGLSLSWNGVYTLSNWVALRQMRRIGRMNGG